MVSRNVSRPVLNRSFLGDLGVGVRSGIKTGVLCSRDRAFPKVGKADRVLRHETGTLYKRTKARVKQREDG